MVFVSLLTLGVVTSCRDYPPHTHTHTLSQGLLFRNPWTADSGETPGEGGSVLERVRFPGAPVVLSVRTQGRWSLP